jgi:ABC-type Fe3+ transport system permease subunit
MGSKERKPRTTLTGRFVRGRRFDRNPLRRPADRAETIVLVLLLVAFLVGAPLAALASGAWAHTMAQRAALAQAATRRQVTAVVLAAPAAPAGPLLGSSDLVSVVRARWTAPDGTVVTSEMPVPIGTRAGATVPVWTTRDGQLTSPPMGDSQVASLAHLGEIAGAAAVALLLALVGIVARRSLDKRRMAAWDADWQSTGPRWTTRA